MTPMFDPEWTARLRRHLAAPRLHLAAIHASTTDSAANGPDTHIDDLVRLASVSKLHTTVVAARVLDRAGVDLDTPITDFADTAWITDVLHVDEGRLTQITFTRLLGHTAGFRDVLSDERFTDAVLADPRRHWEPTELLRLAHAYGPHLFEPGTSFSYSDTGYVIAGLLLERITDTPLGDLYRHHVVKPAGLDATFFEPTDQLPGPISPHVADGVDMADIDTSFDWAGGGIVSTVADAARFVHHLFTGGLVDQTTLERCLRPEPLAHFAPDSTAHYDAYGIGIGTIDLPTGVVHGATGAWGTFAVHDRQRRISIAGSLGDADLDTHAAIAAVHEHLTTENP